MLVWLFIPGVVALIALVRTGAWRFVFLPFTIRAGRMTVDRLGLIVHAPEDITRVNSILGAFAGGFNATITGRTKSIPQAYCESQPPLLRPFAEEGVAMGYTLRNLFLFRPDEFERDVVKPMPEFRYLYYVGLGFWSGMRGHSAQRMESIADKLDLMHKYLCYDGYGFKHGFFDHPKDPACLGRLDALGGYARNAAYQGVGRSFYFRFMAEPQRMIDEIRKLGVHAGDVASGVGLAAAFVNPDRLEVALRFAKKLPQEWHADFHLGMCFGLKARSINNLDRFQRDMSRLDPCVSGAVFASIRECDRVELVVRTEMTGNDYFRWRDRVTKWMVGHIEYPMAGLKSATSGELQRQAARTS